MMLVQYSEAGVYICPYTIFPPPASLGKLFFPLSIYLLFVPHESFRLYFRPFCISLPFNIKFSFIFPRSLFFFNLCEQTHLLRPIMVVKQPVMQHWS